MKGCKNLFCCEKGEYEGFCLSHSHLITGDQILTIVFIIVIILLFIGLKHLHLKDVQQNKPSVRRAAAMTIAREGGLSNGAMICYRIGWDNNGHAVKACERLTNKV